jgi:hypothetical protein
MNLLSVIKPTYGVGYNDGKEVNVGPDYSEK